MEASKAYILIIIQWVFILAGVLMVHFSEKGDISRSSREMLNFLGKTSLVIAIIFGVCGIVLSIFGK